LDIKKKSITMHGNMNVKSFEQSELLMFNIIRCLAALLREP